MVDESSPRRPCLPLGTLALPQPQHNDNTESVSDQLGVGGGGLPCSPCKASLHRYKINLCILSQCMCSIIILDI